MEVKSPYNFVPAPTEDQVFKPDWANQVSHDIPFEDGESGEITLKITAKTPIFIRNGHAKDVEENVFSHIGEGANKRYFIPATSIKGMLRNVLEIMSFSRMKQVDDDRCAFRDLTTNSEYMKIYKSADVKAGWLYEDFNGGWQIDSCENFALISHKELAKPPFNLPFRNEFLEKNPINKTSKYKYDKLVNHSLINKFSVKPNEFNRLIATYNQNGSLGKLVFTGQSSKRKEENVYRPSGKINEFVFFDSANVRTISLSPKQKKDFKFIYLEHDSNNISDDWKYWNTKLKNGSKVPIFYTPDGENAIKHFGLAFMYKLPFEYSIHELMPIKEYKDQIKSIVELPELIFGMVDERKDNKKENSLSLKGRVFISHAFASNFQVLPERNEILGSPKASFFPFYLNQLKNPNSHFSYQDQGAVLNGFKRYPLHDPNNLESFEKRYSEDQRKNLKVFANFKPLDKDSTFDLKIRFHNLKKAEIGALLSAITFHGNENTVFHNIGMAKPLGFGKIKFSKIILKETKHDRLEYLKEFEQLIGYEKLSSERIKMLFAMASASETNKYPILNKNIDEFKVIKNNKDVLVKNQIQNIQIKSIVKLIENKEAISKLGGANPFLNCNSFKELRNQIKNEFNDDANNLEFYIEESILRVFEEKETKKTFRDKSFDDNPWQLPIAIWLGKERAQKLFNKLNINV